MSAPEASKALSAPSLAPIACPDQERRSQIVLELVAENTTLSADRVQVLFDLAKKEVLRQLVASNKAPPAISESYCSWLAEKMVWTRFVPDEPFSFVEPQLSPGLFLQPSAEYVTALLRNITKQRKLMLEAAAGSPTEPNPKWRSKKISPIQRKKLMSATLHQDSRPAITKTRHLTIRSPFSLTLHSSLWKNNVDQLKRILPGSQTLPAVLCPWGRDSPLRLEVTTSALARGFLDVVLLLDKESLESIGGTLTEQYVSGYMLLLKWYLHIFGQTQDKDSLGVNLYGAVIYQREKALGHPLDEAYSWVDNPIDLKVMHEQIACADTSLWLHWQKVAETAYSTSEITKAKTFEEAKAVIYKTADNDSMSGIKREHALLLLHEIWQRRGSFLDRFEIEKEYDRLVSDYLLPDAVSILDTFFYTNTMPEKMREWVAANPFDIKRKDTEQLCELMWRAWRQRTAGSEEKQKGVLFLYQVQHTRKMYREYLAELKLCGKGVEELKEFVSKNEARFHLSEEIRLQLALDEYEKQLEASALVVYQKEGVEETETSQNGKKEKDAEQQRSGNGAAPPEQQPE
ncbi:hypothetical protein GE21DRAFT_9827 [Neurospora crassa]|uniref:Uncharacterized protein n=1 Tax=Neurospora crassa (strain ATCC 24698 / 74-OR23-1A / CBS 708.71 / DSM 1257 / FGSC 987) TaxID=367110 RepID=Q7S3D6_NEUCR|nr:hypothetical protein NCU06917 [Neurospora crassa OR74A]EAA30028.1 hypothetical protein NCU06917 [Neurospora crassa OR74A]KHE88042.1 hypothetical protein GE21DRAFT_9827 [Neurospora crassa]|eukprot:XP_959264.1 hypothetical protein NCU06917 [Neurospora crassa OR74A]